MPSYEKIWFKSELCELSVIPSDTNRRVFARSSPFFNSSFCVFDAVMRVPNQYDFEKRLPVHWTVTNRKTLKVENEKDFVFISTNIKSKRKESNCVCKYKDGWLVFTLKRAILAGRFRDIGNTYSLSLRNSNNTDEEGIVCEFTIKDIDDWGLSDTLNKLTALYALIGLVVGSVITAIVLILF